MDDGLTERLQAVQRLGPVRRGLTQVLEQPRVRRLERRRLPVAQLLREVLARFDELADAEAAAASWPAP